MRRVMWNAKRMVALLTFVMLPLVAWNAEASPLPNTPLQIGDTAFSYVALYPFGGQPQIEFAPIGKGQLNFTLDVTGVDPDLLDAYALFEIRMDIGVQGNTQYVNIVGPVQAGTHDEGLLLGGTLDLFTITKWSFATDGTPIALSYFNMLPPGVQGTLSVEVTAVPEPSTWAMLILGFAGIGFMAHRRHRHRGGALTNN
jgi:hypothetical protein